MEYVPNMEYRSFEVNIERMIRNATAGDACPRPYSAASVRSRVERDRRWVRTEEVFAKRGSIFT